MEKQMANVLTYGLLLIAIIGVAVFIYLMYPTAIRVSRSRSIHGYNCSRDIFMKCPGFGRLLKLNAVDRKPIDEVV